MNLFEDLPEPERRAMQPSGQQTYHIQLLKNRPAKPDWRPTELPELNGERRIVLNAETTGLRWWEDDRPIGWAWALPESGRSGYTPLRHEVGENVPLDRFQEWQRRQLRDVHIENINTKFDLHMSRADGVDLVEQGNTFGDVAHHAALLDDHRLRFNLDQLSLDHLGWDVSGDKLPKGLADESEFRYLHPSLVASYALRNVDQVRLLHDCLEPQIDREDLREVLGLEQEIIPVVVEMEKNGTVIDVELLDRWHREVTTKIDEKLWFVRQNSGILFSSPDSSKDLTALFLAKSIPLQFTEAGNPSFTDEVMKHIDEPCVVAAREAGHLADLNSKYLSKYLKTVRSDGWLRFNLHQLRSVGDGEDKRGTVSGRFSAAGDRFGGYNPQQVVAVEKQLERGWCSDYVIRKLFLMNFAADMMQVEYRIFAHYGNDPQILAVYAANPLADYHKVVMELLHRINPGLNRKLVKNVNFAKIYGAGLLKFAYMIGEITEKVYLELAARLDARDWSVLEDPRLDGARGINDAYDRMFPTVKPLLKLASATAQQRGWVETLMGRRARLVSRFHSALNRVIQGGAADVNKRVLVEVYKLRKQLGLMMRLTVHDELAGNIVDRKFLPEIMKVLNTQYFDLKVPILWDGKFGNNWAECK